MVVNPFKKDNKQDADSPVVESEAAVSTPPALQAFTSRFLSKKSVELTPEESEYSDLGYAARQVEEFF